MLNICSYSVVTLPPLPEHFRCFGGERESVESTQSIKSSPGQHSAATPAAPAGTERDEQETERDEQETGLFPLKGTEID